MSVNFAASSYNVGMEEQKLIAALLAALAVNELVHIIFEIWGIRQKVAWLTARMDKKPHGDWPLNINTITRTLLLHTGMFIVFVGLVFLLLIKLGLATHVLMWVAVVALVVTYAFTVLGMDAYHSEIGGLLRRYKRRGGDKKLGNRN